MRIRVTILICLWSIGCFAQLPVVPTFVYPKASGGGGGSVAFVSAAGNHWFGGSGTTESITLNGVTAGNLLAISVGWANSQTISTIAGNGNTYTLIDNRVNGTSGSLSTYYVKNCSSGNTTITVTFSADPGAGSLIVQQFSGASITSPLDQHTTAIVVNPSGTVSVGPVTTVSNGEGIFVAVIDPPGSATLSAGAGFTLQPSSQTSIGSAEEQIQVSSGAITGSFTESGGNFESYIAAIATFH